MSPEEREKYLKEHPASLPPGQGPKGVMAGNGLMLGRILGINGVKPESIKHEITNIAKGIQVTITSDDPAVVAKIQEAAKKATEKTKP